MKPVYALVTILNNGKETTVEGWVASRLEGDALVLRVQPSLEFIEGGLTLEFLFGNVVSIMPTLPITAYTETVPIVDGQNIAPESSSLDTLW